MLPDADLRIKLQVFEGPLDLLLFLIRKNEIDIYDIPIESVTKQYVAVLRSMQELDLEVAGEFFVMAASLMEIKSRMLLPKGLHAVDPDADGQDEMDPRWELVHQLLQYKKFKDAAGAALGDGPPPARPHGAPVLRPADGLAGPAAEGGEPDRALEHVQPGPAPPGREAGRRRDPRRGRHGGRPDGVASREDARPRRSFVFSSLFEKGVSLRRLVATFLAVLELTRLSRMRLRQNEAFTDIVCEAADENPLETPADPATVEL